MREHSKLDEESLGAMTVFLRREGGCDAVPDGSGPLPGVLIAEDRDGDLGKVGVEEWHSFRRFPSSGTALTGCLSERCQILSETQGLSWFVIPE